MLLYLQGTYGKVQYDIIGDGSAVTYFEIGKTSGLINVRTDLSTTSIREFTVSSDKLVYNSIFDICFITIIIIIIISIVWSIS